MLEWQRHVVKVTLDVVWLSVADMLFQKVTAFWDFGALQSVMSVIHRVEKEKKQSAVVLELAH